MTSKFAAIAAFALASSGLIGAASAGQLAGSLGVDADRLSTAELVALKSAQEAGDLDRAAFILDGAARGDVTASDQLAASLGVAPGAYTAAELTALKNAVERDEADRAAFVTGSTAVTSRDAATNGAGDQLARALNVEPGSRSTAELASAYLDATGAGDS
ncbi:hypothetical protein [Mangrovicoccus algicola]|uniref:Uncharacterized protein n=1 Tax=Mangrovicoccus algicola TaxID=2771008 RepID=A0A8J6YX23_9RHOB|nr:hypothetical protein [Mangrovicoccus algicola]MBE3639187.1 hypothetical protein [Mangrovicoccus algicola]